MAILLHVTFEYSKIMFDFDRTFTYKHFIHGLTNILEMSESWSYKCRLYNDQGLLLTPSAFNNVVRNLTIMDLNIIVKVDNDREVYEQFKVDLEFRKKLDSNCCGTPSKNTNILNHIRNQTKSEKYVRL